MIILIIVFGMLTIGSIMNGNVIPAIICGFLTLLNICVLSDENAHYRAQVNRDRYWAYGEEPDWKRQKRIRQQREAQAWQEREAQRLERARQKAERKARRERQKNRGQDEREFSGGYTEPVNLASSDPPRTRQPVRQPSPAVKQLAMKTFVVNGEKLYVLDAHSTDMCPECGQRLRFVTGTGIMGETEMRGTYCDGCDTLWTNR